MIFLALKKLDLLKRILLGAGCLIALILLGPYLGLHIFGTSPSQSNSNNQRLSPNSGSLHKRSTSAELKESRSIRQEIRRKPERQSLKSEEEKTQEKSKKNKLSEIEQLLK